MTNEQLLTMIGSITGIIIAQTMFLKHYIDAKIGAIDEKFNTIDERFNTVNTKIDSIAKQVDKLVDFMVNHAERISALEEKTKKLN